MTKQLSTRGVFALLILLITALPALAQDDQVPPDSLVLDAVGKFSFTQAAYSNWREGGLNTVSITSGLDTKARRQSAIWEQVHEVRLAYGLIQQDTLDFRKAKDIFRLASQLQYTGKGFFRRFNPTLAAKLRTQFAPGYNYDKVPESFDEELTTPVKVSDSFSPAVLTQTVGLTYSPIGWFSHRLGFGFKETVVLIERFRPLNYGEQSEQLDQPLRFEAGVESHTEIDREIFENVRLKSTLGLFYAYNQLEEPPDALWENMVTLGVNEWLSVNVEGTMLFDQNIDTRPQFKETLSVGISYALL